MIPAFVEANVFGWLAQVLILGTVGALLPLLFRLRHARSLVVYSHMILVICLAFPFVQPRHAAVVSVQPMADPQAPATAVVPVAEQTPPPGSFPWAAATFWVLAAGFLVRLTWLGAGLWRIRRYREASNALGSAGSGDARRPAGVTAEFRISRELDSPATFGLFRPVVLLPESFLTMGPDAQSGIACHELIHVRRRDWLVTVAEELALAPLWFHPGLWWLVARARLAREEIVDAEVVRRTADRDSYVQALLEMAGRHRPRLAPVSMFSDGRELKWRVSALLSEVSMSKSRLLASYAAMAVLVGLAGWTALTAFPLLAAPVVQEAPDVLEPELQNVNTVLRELVTKLEAITRVEGEAGAGVQEAPVPEGRGQRGVLGGVVAPPVIEAYFNVIGGVQAPLEEISPGVVRLQAVAGAANSLTLGFSAVRTARVEPGAEAREVIEGEVTVLLTFNADGEIVDSRVSSGPDPLRRQALQMALRQNYGEQFSRVLQVVVEFVPPPPPPPPGAGGRGARGGGAGGPVPE